MGETNPALRCACPVFLTRYYYNGILCAQIGRGATAFAFLADNISCKTAKHAHPDLANFLPGFCRQICFIATINQA
ncbi:MAG: hypothetical protein DU429_01185 [Candidatus Tokpelaia sp.]|nr:MAG: hypothetical protein DU430_02815 [Candidatus Tokpelaia sp.]KAA6207683.1 MAG: hypothetical protein DU429_01185 [Candidatus Tokpelaia sp.]KAA6404858.1 hypothetical protein DPQ22_08120 [Candidatus Tokpelaia sp.]